MSYPDVQLETERLLSRLPRIEDFERYPELRADEAACRHSGGHLPRGAAWRRFLQMPGAWAVQGFAMFKVRLLLEQLDRPYVWIETDSSRGETRTPAYLAKNPNGQVPRLALDDGRVLVESNAILCFLAAGTPLLPNDPWQYAQALRWMFFEQYSHEPAIAVARFIRGWTDADSPRRAELPTLQARGHRALAVMDGHLAGGAARFSGSAYGVADIALFASTAVASDGGFDLTRYPTLRDWLARVRRTPGFIDMPAAAPVNAARLAALD